MNPMSLESALDKFQVLLRADNDENVSWWPEALEWGVSDDEHGVIALFMTEQAACAYRLMLVNQACNPSWNRI